MREIKFRAWDKKLQKLARKAAIFFSGTGNLVEYHYFNTDDDMELTQYTSLKDKKGREIYENDIVKTKIGVMDFVLKVVFENGKFMAVGDDDDLTAFDLFTIADKCEVISNIYENSELLK